MAEAEPMTPVQAQPVIVTLPAEIDMANADSIGKQLAAASGPGVAVVIADMTATFCDSVGVQMLVLARRQAVTVGTDLRLVLPCPHVLRVMKIQGVDAVLPIYRNLDEALSGLAVRPAVRRVRHLRMAGIAARQAGFPGLSKELCGLTRWGRGQARVYRWMPG